ncbi:MAG: 5-formyltetrahydrofolate cyclo-ligase [Bacteroidetes bacterium]|nr:5-formyltetrahydrofolate cyclo-ligase [Bacteroidota bacterium]
MTKQNIRPLFLAQRKALSEVDNALLSQKLMENFFSFLDVSSIHTVHIFLPMQGKNEPDTWLIINRLQQKFPQIKISIPKVLNNELISFYFEGEHQVALNKWGIPEPAFGVITPPEKIDWVIVPLLAFDKRGHRVGYGKGFYDRFLKECRPDCQKIGLSFFDPVNDISDAAEHDEKLTGCITPQKFYTF